MQHLTEAQRKDIEKRVYQKYPVTKEEMTCTRKKDYRDGIRAEYRKRIMREYQSEKVEYKQGINTTVRIDKQEV